MNVYADFQFWADNTNYPNGYRLMNQGPHPEYFEHAYWMTAGDKTEMTTEWIKVYQPTYGGITMSTSTAGSTAGFCVVKDGRYVPGQVTAGNTTNTKDFSKLYNAVRGVWWGYWDDPNASDQHGIQIAERPTVGSVNHGALNLACDRNYLSEWRIWGSDGDGAAIGPSYVAGSVKVDGDSCGIQWEMVKGSHLTLKLYKNVNASLNFSTFTMPTWPIAESGNYVKISLTTGNLAKLTPTSIYVTCASSLDTGVGRTARLAYEYMAIGNSNWLYLK